MGQINNCKNSKIFIIQFILKIQYNDLNSLFLHRIISSKQARGNLIVYNLLNYIVQKKTFWIINSMYCNIPLTKKKISVCNYRIYGGNEWFR